MKKGGVITAILIILIIPLLVNATPSLDIEYGHDYKITRYKDNTQNIIIGGPRYADSKGTKIEDAKSLKDCEFCGNIKLEVKSDGKNLVKVLDYNYTSIQIEIKLLSSQLNQDIPLIVYAKENKSELYYDSSVNLKYTNDKSIITLVFGFDKEIEFGENSTIITLTVNDNLQDISICTGSCGANTGSQSRWNISMIPESKIITNATFCAKIKTIVGEFDNVVNVEKVNNYTWTESASVSSFENMLLDNLTIETLLPNAIDEEISCINVTKQLNADYSNSMVTTSFRIENTAQPLGIIDQTVDTTLLYVGNSPFIAFASSENTGEEPYLDITYTNQSSPPEPATYYVSNSGNDSNDGLSEANAFKTINHTNSVSCNKGDIIKFNRSCSWRTSRVVYGSQGTIADATLSPVDGVTYSAYGTGSKPEFIASFEYNNPSNWEEISSNIWKLNYTGNGTQYATNPSFDTDLTGWAIDVNTGEGTYERNTTVYHTAPASMKINITNVGKYTNGIRVHTDAASDFPIVDDRYYKITFWARSNNTITYTDGGLKLTDSSFNTQYTNTEDTNYIINTTWQYYEMTYEASATDPDAYFTFFLGKGRMINNTDLFIDDVSIEEINVSVIEAIDVGNIIFNNSITAIKYNTQVGGLEQLDANRKFLYNESTWKLWLYADANPATKWSDIEVATEKNIISPVNNTNFYNLTLKYGGRHGIGGSNLRNVTIIDCNISYIGGALQSGTTRYGNCIEFFQSSDNINIISNTIDNCYDAGITAQVSSTAHNVSNINVSYNLVKRCAYPFEYFNSQTGSIIENVSITQNTFVRLGYGFLDEQPTGSAPYVRLASTTVDTTNFIFKDNIIALTKGSRLIGVSRDSTSNWKGQIDSDYNLYYNESYGSIIYEWFNGDYNTIAAVTAATNNETNSIQENPLFIDLDNGDFSPVKYSSACTMSSTGSYVGALPCLTTTCTCPEGVYWQVNMTEECTLSTDCNNENTLNFTETGNLTINATLNVSSFGTINTDNITNNIIYLTYLGRINLG